MSSEIKDKKDKKIESSPEKKSDDNIVANGINMIGNEYTVYKDGQYSYRNMDAVGEVRSHYFNGGSSGINNYHETQRDYSWFENKNTGETNRPTAPTQKDQDE